ncbi:MAG: hypothetical protein LBC07_03200 [Elusimicrobiota bacterium]|jgi:hypothetical protein|nr:hypothetical protein [Elusimicrobiota bacterium]
MREFWGELKSLALEPRFAKTICKIALTFFVLTWVYFIFLDPYFFRHIDDMTQIINTTGIGKNIITIVRQSGRFWPLGLSYYNFLTTLPYGYTSQAHYMLNSLIFVVFILVLMKVIDFNWKQQPVHLYIKTFLIFCLPFILGNRFYIFFNLIYAETFLCLLLAFFVLCYKKMMFLDELQVDKQAKDFSYGKEKCKFFKDNFRWLKDPFTLEQQKTCWAVLAILVAIFATYCKETMFIVFLIIACINFLFAKKPLTKIDKIFNFALVVNVLCFLLIYYFTVVPYVSEKYASVDMTGHTLKFNSAIFGFISVPILSLLGIFVIIRIFFVLFKKDKRYVFYDGLLFASFGYYIVVVSLGFHPDYYYIVPVIVLFFIVLAHWTIVFYDTKKYIVLSMIFIIIFLLGVEGGGGGDSFVK